MIDGGGGGAGGGYLFVAFIFRLILFGYSVLLFYVWRINTVRLLGFFLIVSYLSTCVHTWFV